MIKKFSVKEESVTMTLIDISRELELATDVSAPEIRRELAVQLYAQGKLSRGLARELAEMSVVEF